MAPSEVPEEVDVYRVPHSRMKQLVNECMKKCDTTNFSGDLDLEALLSTLIRTFVEFKNHEMIENALIMRKLKHKLKKLSIKNSAVCNCHKDSHLIDMLKILKEGFRKKTEQDRINYGIQLRLAIEEFAEDFLPHMKEEEETFGPLLLKYFTYDELKELRSKVIAQHFEEKQDQVEDILAAEELEKWALDQQIKETSSSSSGCESEDDCRNVIDSLQQLHTSVPVATTQKTIDDIPPEVTLQIFSFLNPRDLCRSAQVCKQWSSIAMDPSLWKHLHPVEWAKGNWDYQRSYRSDSMDNDDDYDEYFADSDEHYIVIDDDADVDESEMPDDNDEEQNDIIRQLQQEGKVLLGLKNYLVPVIGESVELLNLANCRALTNGVLQKLLKHCPNIETLDLTQTRISDSALKGLGTNKICGYIKYLNLSGCHNISDATLMRLAMAINKPLWDKEVLSDSSEETGGAALMLEDCVCSKYENMKQSVKNCKKAKTCQIKLKEHFKDEEKDIDESNESSNLTSFGRKAHFERTLDAISSNDSNCVTIDKNVRDKASVKNGNHKTVDAFRTNPKDVCHTKCFDLKNTVSKEEKNIEECGRGEPSNNVLSVINKGDEDSEFGYLNNYGDKANTEVALEYLSLSGCYQITDKGISALYGYGPLQRLKYLDLSGCMNIGSEVLTTLVDSCPRLDETNLFYCDNIIDGPYATTANGCNNFGCSKRFCCRRDV